jgi:hypothetical protein
MAKDIEQAIAALWTLVDRGVEYPDAEWKISQRFKLDRRDIETLRERYDSDERRTCHDCGNIPHDGECRDW